MGDDPSCGCGLFSALSLMRQIAAIADETVKSHKYIRRLTQYIPAHPQLQYFFAHRACCSSRLDRNERAMLLQQLIDIDYECAILESPNVPLCRMLQQLEQQVHHPFTTLIAGVSKN